MVWDNAVYSMLLLQVWREILPNDFSDLCRALFEMEQKGINIRPTFVIGCGDYCEGFAESLLGISMAGKYGYINPTLLDLKMRGSVLWRINIDYCKNMIRMGARENREELEPIAKEIGLDLNEFIS